MTSAKPPKTKPEQFKDTLEGMKTSMQDKLKVAQIEADTFLSISDDLDVEALRTPKLYNRYLNLYTTESLTLKELYTFKEKVRLERWKYYCGKQTEKYCAENGILHEKVLKTDIDKYLAADDKLCTVNDVINIQKALVDFYEKILKEISNRNFHLKVALDWRKFLSAV